MKISLPTKCWIKSVSITLVRFIFDLFKAFQPIRSISSLLQTAVIHFVFLYLLMILMYSKRKDERKRMLVVLIKDISLTSLFYLNSYETLIQQDVRQFILMTDENRRSTFICIRTFKTY